MSYENIFAKACLIQLSTSCWTGTRMLQAGVMESIGNSDWLKGKKLLINPELLGPIKTTIHKARQVVAKTALPFPLTGLYLVPKESIENVDVQLESIKAEFWDKVDNFLTFYTEAREEARQVIGELFNETDYPENIQDKFRFDWRFVTLATPNQANILTPELYTREVEKFQSLMSEARDMSILALREEFAGLVGHLVERMTTGKPKSFKSTMLNGTKEFFESFNDRNIFDDAKLSELVEEAKLIVSQASVGSFGNSLSYNEVVRKRFSDDMAVLKMAIDEAIEELPRRRIRLGEECLQNAA
jgi:hypothetical protein